MTDQALKPRWPLRVAIATLIAVLLHMIPFWHAQWSAPDGYEFTGNLTVSPDYMQYRVWERQVLREGPIISNAFAIESDVRHLPVFYYWAIGTTARALGVRPEFVYAYSGALFAVVVSLLVWSLVRRYVADYSLRWWSYLAIMFGGGLGAHLKILESVPFVKDLMPVRRFVIEPLAEWPGFEQYRGHYVFRALYDSHYLLLWVAGLLAVYALARSVERYSVLRVGVAALAYAGLTWLHVYEGVTLLAVAAGVVLAQWRDVDARRSALRTLVWCTVAVAASYGLLGYLYSRSGLPLPPWRAVNILFAIVVLAFPLAWWLMAVGLRQYWRDASVRERFLVGWAGGCLVVTLSGPFYPYPDRGTLTMSVPVLLIAAIIFRQRGGRMTRQVAALCVCVFAAGPVWQFARSWVASGFRPDAPFIHATAAHVATGASLAQRAGPGDVLLAEPSDLLWLAPSHPGKFYVGHFFLTVDYAAKLDSLRSALSTPATLPAFLAASRARWVFVNVARDAAAINQLPDLRAVLRNETGTLYEVQVPVRGAGS